MNGQGPNPSGFCMCGCGQPASVAKISRPQQGHVKGQPVCFIKGHHNRIGHVPAREPNPAGLCQCGCGQRTPMARQSRAKEGWVKGKPIRYCFGHSHPSGSAYYVVDEATGCWVWQGGDDHGKGYGRIHRYGRTMPAHRYFYELAKGPIPDGLELDHLCRNVKCVNPDHLEPVTPRENVRRGTTPAARNMVATHCVHGHPLAGANLYIARDGHRQCRACQRRSSRDYRARKRAEK